MPVALIVALVGLFSFGLGKSASQTVKVTYVDEQGITQEANLQKPIIVVKEGDTLSVRSAFVMKGSYPPASPRFDVTTRAFNDGAFERIRRQEDK